MNQALTEHIEENKSLPMNPPLNSIKDNLLDSQSNDGSSIASMQELTLARLMRRLMTSRSSCVSRYKSFCFLRMALHKGKE